jgi:hypothetical protein
MLIGYFLFCEYMMRRVCQIVLLVLGYDAFNVIFCMTFAGAESRPLCSALPVGCGLLLLCA